MVSVLLGAAGRYLPAMVTLLVAAFLVTDVAAALPSGPLGVTLSPGRLEVGAPAAITLETLPYLAPDETATHADLYVVRVPGGRPVPRYLWPTGVWSETPGPYAGDVPVTRLAATRVDWREEGPPGWLTLVVLFVRPGSDPGNREAWLFRPVVLRPPVGPGPGATSPIGSLILVGGAALIAIVVLTLVRTSPRDP